MLEYFIFIEKIPFSAYVYIVCFVFPAIKAEILYLENTYERVYFSYPL